MLPAGSDNACLGICCFGLGVEDYRASGLRNFKVYGLGIFVINYDEKIRNKVHTFWGGPFKVKTDCSRTAPENAPAVVAASQVDVPWERLE